MPVLKNPKHERFAQELVRGSTATDAYVTAGFKPDDGNAARLANNPAVRERVQELTGRLTEKVMEKAAISKAWVLERLVENADRAMQATPVSDGDGLTGEYRYEGSVANRALELIGKELGMFVERKEIGQPGDFERMTDEELLSAISEEAAEIGLHKASLKARGNGTAH